MNGAGYVDDLESMLEGGDFGEFEERARRGRAPVPTPSRRSSYSQRPAPTAASQAQLQAASRNLDGKIETLSHAVKVLENRTNGLTADQQRTAAALRKEAEERKKSAEAIRGDLQQTKLLGVLLPMLTQETIEVKDKDDRTVKVVTQSQNQIATLLPFLLLMGGTGGDAGAKGPLGDGMLPLLLIVSLTGRR